VKFGKPEQVKKLISKGADVDSKNNDGNTPLHLAAIYGTPEIVANLISKGADVDSKNNNGNTPLHLAAIHGTPEIVANLIEKRARVDSKNNNESTPLHLCWYNEDEEHGVKIAEKLIAAVPPEKRKQYLNTKNKDGNTPLHRAAEYGKPELVKKLISKGADIYARNKDGDTPLHRAVKNKNEVHSYHIVRMLIERPSDSKRSEYINTKNNDRRTALENCYDKDVRSLLQRNLSRNLVENPFVDEYGDDYW
jgi:ankyrin repeat protein